MFPILFSIGEVTIRSFGLFLLIAFLCCLYIVWKRTREEGLPEERVIDVFFLAIGALIVFGRLGYVFANWSVFQTDLGRIVLFFRYPGLSFSFGLLAAALVSVGLSRLFAVATFLILDIFFLGLTLAMPFWFLGRFLDGGKDENPQASLALALAFSLFFVSVRLAIAKIKKSPDLHEFSRKPGWVSLCYLIFTSVSLLISSYLGGEKVSNVLILVGVISAGAFLFRYFEFLKGVKWLSFPKAFLSKSENTLRKGTRIWKREFWK